ncbi:uncharacterized protein G2W53_021691 [Senna tora]|uniref:Uncharacterized protein n=1 Tax=Senna tora TaxID=362788 RepID=A0A834TLH3_9FABA|nr:uncharacterized protein G2W53_021691 [Senna tora]
MDSIGWIKVRFNVPNTGSWMEPPKVERAINGLVSIEWAMLNTGSCMEPPKKWKGLSMDLCR